MTTGIIVFAHGSRVESANQAVRSVAEALARAGNLDPVQAAFLELGKPSLEEAAADMVAAGVGRLLIVPYFLTLGLHMERDLPVLLANISKSHNGIEVSCTPPLDGHPALVEILRDRVAAGLREPTH